MPETVIDCRWKRLPSGQLRAVCGAPSCPVELGVIVVGLAFQVGPDRPPRLTDAAPSRVVELTRAAGYWKDDQGRFHLVGPRYARDGTPIGRRQLHEGLERHARRLAARELGLPEDQVVYLEAEGATFSPDWEGYRLDFAGIPASPPRSPDEYPYAEIEGIGLQIWRLRIRHGDSQAYIEATWRPGEPIFGAVDLRGVDPTDRRGNELALCGIGLLFPFLSRRRPPGSGQYPTAADFHAAREAALDALRAENIRPTPELVAQDLFLSKRRYYELLRQWPPRGE